MQACMCISPCPATRVWTTQAAWRLDTYTPTMRAIPLRLREITLADNNARIQAHLPFPDSLLQFEPRQGGTGEEQSKAHTPTHDTHARPPKRQSREASKRQEQRRSGKHSKGVCTVNSLNQLLGKIAAKTGSLH